jgi:sarcosine oxidase subunit alpha
MSLQKRFGSTYRVDTDTPISFTFDGKKYIGYQGDTLASALLANSVRIIGRSFKLHRPRGVMSVSSEEPNALVQLASGGFDEPSARATTVPLYEGLVASSQNSWPNANFDIFGGLSLLHRLFPASFYYKSMMWPNWHFYEGVVRKMAGLGKAPKQKDAQIYHKQNAYCDLLIIGAGPSGLSAALTAAKNGLRVIIVDDQEEFGGSLLSEKYQVNADSAMVWVKKTTIELKSFINVQVMPRTTVSGYYDHNFLTAVERITNHLGSKADLSLPREKLWRIRAKQVVVATGSIERPLVFENNDRPGIMLAFAVRAYLNRYGVIVGKKIAVFTNNDNAYRTAIDLYDAGVRSVCVIDTRKESSEKLSKALSDRSIKLFQGYTVKKVHGKRSLKAVTITDHKGGGEIGKKIERINCDILAMSGGWTPTIHLYSQAGGSLDYDEEHACLVPRECSQAVSVVGGANGSRTLQKCLAEGYGSAAEIVETLSSVKADIEVPSSCDSVAENPTEAYWFTKGVNNEKQWLDFQYDVKVADIELAQRENFISVEHVKRYTTNGMSVDQGKTSNVNTLAVMSELQGRPILDVGTTRFRPPYNPVTIGAFVGTRMGEGYAPRLELPANQWHLDHNAAMGDYGYSRPEFYPQKGEDIHAATLREVRLVRNGVGIFDGSPLGKIMVKGPDAAKFLTRVYINNVKSLKINSARYGFMANENGVLIDDGVFVRISDNEYILHATSGAQARIALMLEELLQCEWPDLNVIVNNVTTQWANVTISGPKSRLVVEKLNSDIDFSREAFPHMQFRKGTVEGVEARVLRASFTGEITYEISVARRYATALLKRIYELGEEFDIAPYGIEALEVLRTEKGYLHIGADTDGTTNARDVGWGFIIDKKVDDFIGKRSSSRPADTQEGRFQFTGLEAVDPTQELPVGGHIIDAGSTTIPVKTQGYVTSACMSPTLDNKSVGLGIVKDASKRLNEEVTVFANGKRIAARIVAPAHFDPKGERLNG